MKNLSILALFILFSPVLSQSSTSQCIGKLTQIFQQGLSIFLGGDDPSPSPQTSSTSLSDKPTDRQVALHFILDSGLALNDLGNYEDCVSDLDKYDSKYFIIMLLRKPSTIVHNSDSQYQAKQAPRNLKIGLCVPGQCNEKQIKDQLKGFIESYIIPKYEITTVIDTSKKPHFLDSNQTNAYKLTLIIISVLLILMGILGIFIQKTTLGDTQNQEEFMSSRDNKYNDQDKGPGAIDSGMRLKSGRNSSINPFQSDDLDRDDFQNRQSIAKKQQQKHYQKENSYRSIAPSNYNSSVKGRQQNNVDQSQSRQKMMVQSTINSHSQANTASSNNKSRKTSRIQRKSILEIARKKALMGKILLCFSLLNNFLNIIRKSGRNRFHIFDGVRVYLIAWIVVADTIFYTLRYGTLVNFDSLQAIFLHDFWFSLLATLPFIASGAYFFTSGFLSLNWLLHMQTVKYDRTHYCLLLGRYYIHRLIRLWPAYIYVLFATIYMSNIFVSGPLEQDYQLINYQNGHLCRYYYNIFFINSIIQEESCLTPWTAFLSTDVILVFLLPLFVFLVQLKRRYVRQYKYAYILVVLLIIVGLVISIGVNQNQPVFMVVNSSYLWIVDQILYPLNFIAPFSAGMLCALLIRDGHFDEVKESFRRKKAVRYLLYLGAVALFVLVAVYNWWITRQHATGGTYNDGYSNPYTSWNYLIPIAIFLHSVAFGVIMMSMMLGRANFIAWFLKSRLFTIGARLFLLAFLCHPSIILVFVISAEDSTYLRISQILYYALANLAISNTVAFVICLLVEMPSRNIRKLFIKFNIKGGKNRNPFPLLDKELTLLSKGSYANYN